MKILISICSRGLGDNDSALSFAEACVDETVASVLLKDRHTPDNSDTVLCTYY